jgi:hypothetical protein
MLVSLKLALEPSGDSGKMSCIMSAAFLPFLGSKRLQKETRIEAALLCHWALPMQQHIGCPAGLASSKA